MINEILQALAHGKALTDEADSVVRSLGKVVMAYEALQDAKRESYDAALDCLEALGIDVEEDEEDEDEEEPEAESAYEEPDEVEEEDENEEPVSAEPIVMDEESGLPTYEAGKAPAWTITRPELQESIGYASSAFTKYLRNHPEHPQPIGRVRQAGGGIPTALFDRSAVNTYWQAQGRF